MLQLPLSFLLFRSNNVRLNSCLKLIPLLLASVSAALTSTFILGDEVLFDIKVVGSIYFWRHSFYILLGVLTGLVSVYFSKVFWFIEDKFEEVKAFIQEL